MGKVEILAGQIEYSQAANCSPKEGNLSAAREYGISSRKTALKIEHFYGDEDVEFRVKSKREMRAILQSIANQGTRVALFHGGGQHFIQTTLLDVSEHGIWLDAGAFPPENRQLLLTDKITFVSIHQHVKIQFVGQDVEGGLFENNEAFYIGLPEYLLRIQRREFFRTPIPSTPPVKCTIPIQPESPSNTIIMRAIPLVDISGGGIGLLCGEDESALLPEKVFPDCQISIPEVGTLTVTLEVRNGIAINTPNNVAHTRVGCRFIRLDNQTNILLQRYITGLQSGSLARGHLSS